MSSLGGAKPFIKRELAANDHNTLFSFFNNSPRGAFRATVYHSCENKKKNKKAYWENWESERVGLFVMETGLATNVRCFHPSDRRTSAASQLSLNQTKDFNCNISQKLAKVKVLAESMDQRIKRENAENISTENCHNKASVGLHDAVFVFIRNVNSAHLQPITITLHILFTPQTHARHSSCFP